MEVKLTVPKIEIKQLIQSTCSIIDVRSPSEYREFHIPGAINLPIFSDEERAEVGTIYKQKGNEFAKERGVAILSNKLPALYEEVKELSRASEGKPIIVYCWRGGMRSRSIVSVMGMLDIPTIQLEGGVRAYRRLITEELEASLHQSKKYIVLEGLTGTKKTDILIELQKKGYPVIDLELLAGHRGSIFGHIGLHPRSQKEFESLLYTRLTELRKFPYYVIEAESKRIGNVNLPDFLMIGKEKGIRIHLDMTLEDRAKTICDTYRLEENSEQFIEAIHRLKKRLSIDTFTNILSLLEIGDYHSIVELLLKNYYDPRYGYAFEKYITPIHPIFIESLEEGLHMVTEKIKEIVEEYSIV
ncbi:tRNA 2-selenouridine(34) synthase MnmH [Bacillus sp. DJP31]|uniref:tRNA 2-selenouridine(34) synthase MnmH n=1 Tax=Bacillus sp. DJP31 TaxID=3409789 RepID=UPI003BB5D72A